MKRDSIPLVVRERLDEQLPMHRITGARGTYLEVFENRGILCLTERARYMRL